MVALIPLACSMLGISLGAATLEPGHYKKRGFLVSKSDGQQVKEVI